MPENDRDALLRPAPDLDAIRARQLATVRRLLAERVQARGIVYLGDGWDDAAYQLYHEAGEPYGGGAAGLVLWLDDQARPEDLPHE